MGERAGRERLGKRAKDYYVVSGIEKKGRRRRKKKRCGEFLDVSVPRYILALRRIFSGYNKPTSKSSSFSCIISFIFLFCIFFFVCWGFAFPPFGYIQTRCCVYFHLSACLHVMLPLLCLLTSFSSSSCFDLIRFLLWLHRKAGRIDTSACTDERETISAGRSSSRGIFAHIYMEYSIYNI